MTLFVTPPADDAEAKEVLTRAYEEVIGPVNAFGLGFAQAVGLMEGSYGKWGPNNASNNWGAITRSPNDDGSCPADSFGHQDSSFELGTYDTCFRKYATSLDGAKHFLKILYLDRPAVFEAAELGMYQEAIREMYETSYFMGTEPHEKVDANGEFSNVNNYIAFVGRGIDQIADLYAIEPEAPSASNTAWIALAAVGVVGVIAIANR